MDAGFQVYRPDLYESGYTGAIGLRPSRFSTVRNAGSRHFRSELHAQQTSGLARLQEREPSATACTEVALNIELQCNIYCLFSLYLRFWRVKYTGLMN
jgi:hypothetical protein